MRISGFCDYMRKFYPQNLGCGILRHGKSKQSAKVFSVKIVFSPICESFLPQKFPAIRYCHVTQLSPTSTLHCFNIHLSPFPLPSFPLLPSPTPFSLLLPTSPFTSPTLSHSLAHSSHLLPPDPFHLPGMG